MFKSFELFTGQTIDRDIILNNLVAFRYTKVKKTSQEGEFALRGEILDIFPVNFDGPVRIDFDDDQIRAIASYNMVSGKSIWQHKALIIIPNKNKRKSREEVFSADIPLNNFVDIEDGDYVVHSQHGVGKFLGVEKIQVTNKNQDHFVIEYDGGDRLFVPKHDLRLIQKYISFNKRPPRLYKLGSNEWKRVKLQIHKRLQRLASELLHIQAMRASLSGHAFTTNKEWQAEFEKGFPFEETEDQIKAMREVDRDMASETPMDRLLCGDVGYGKTEVALRAAFKAVMDGKQVAVLVPTTILAEQHYINFSRRMRDFPIKVGMLSRFRTKGEQVAIIKDAIEGRVDVLIGTHRLLSKDVGF